MGVPTPTFSHDPLLPPLFNRERRSRGEGVNINPAEGPFDGASLEPVPSKKKKRHPFSVGRFRSLHQPPLPLPLPPKSLPSTPSLTPPPTAIALLPQVPNPRAPPSQFLAAGSIVSIAALTKSLAPPSVHLLHPRRRTPITDRICHDKSEKKAEFRWALIHRLEVPMGSSPSIRPCYPGVASSFTDSNFHPITISSTKGLALMAAPPHLPPTPSTPSPPPPPLLPPFPQPSPTSSQPRRTTRQPPSADLLHAFAEIARALVMIAAFSTMP